MYCVYLLGTSMLLGFVSVSGIQSKNPFKTNGNVTEGEPQLHYITIMVKIGYFLYCV